MPKLLLYCTKSRMRLFFDKVKQIFSLGKIKSNNDLNGKIVAECDFEVEEIIKDISSVVEEWYSKELLKKSCLTAFELDDYLKDKNGYAIHIKNLHIFDEPKELSEYRTSITDKDRLNNFVNVKNFDLVSVMLDEWLIEEKSSKTLENTPKNIQKIIRSKGNNKYEYVILISVSPEEMCRIANKKQTILIRKKILKEMIK